MFTRGLRIPADGRLAMRCSLVWPDALCPPLLIPRIPTLRPARWRRGALDLFPARRNRAGLVELALCPLGPGPQIGPGLLQHRGARLGGGLDAAQLGGVLALAALSSASAAWTRACMASRSSSRSRVASARTWSSIRARLLVRPVGVGPRRVRAGLGRGGPLPGGAGGFLVLGRLLARLVAVGLGGADEGLGLGAGPLDRLPRFGGRAVGALTGGSDGGGLVRLSRSHCGVPVGGRGADLPCGLAPGMLDGLVGLLPDGLPGFLVLDDPFPQFRLGGAGVGAAVSASAWAASAASSAVEPRLALSAARPELQRLPGVPRRGQRPSPRWITSGLVATWRCSAGLLAQGPNSARRAGQALDVSRRVAPARLADPLPPAPGSPPRARRARKAVRCGVLGSSQ